MVGVIEYSNYHGALVITASLNDIKQCALNYGQNGTVWLKFKIDKERMQALLNCERDAVAVTSDKFFVKLSELEYIDSKDDDVNKPKRRKSIFDIIKGDK